MTSDKVLINHCTRTGSALDTTSRNQLIKQYNMICSIYLKSYFLGKWRLRSNVCLNGSPAFTTFIVSFSIINLFHISGNLLHVCFLIRMHCIIYYLLDKYNEIEKKCYFLSHIKICIILRDCNSSGQYLLGTV